MAHTVIVGNLGKDPELKESQSGKKYARLSVAWSERHKDRTGDYVDGPTTWVSVTVFGRQAENVVSSLGKGMMVVCSGDMRTELWSSDQGEKPAVAMTATIVAPALFSQVVTVSKDEQRQQSADYSPQHPAAPQGNTWGQPATTGQADDETPPF